MNVHLLFRDRDFDLKAAPPPAAALTQDLGLAAVFDAMGERDDFLRDMACKVVLASLTDAEEIAYRQRILADCLAQPAIVRDMYAIAVEAIERERRIWGWTLNRYPEPWLHRSLEALRVLLGMLRRLRVIADQQRGRFRSDGIESFFVGLQTELDDAYLSEVADHLKRLELRDGLLLTAMLGDGHKAAGYTLRRFDTTRHGWLDRLQTWVGQLKSAERSSCVYEIDPRDEAGLQALGDIRGRGVSVVATRLGEAVDHVLGFFTVLRAELGFYVGCLNLSDRIARKGQPLTIPEALSMPATATALSAKGLYDIALTLSMDERAVGNDLQANGKQLIVITGANRGGKTTFHRSLGQAQLMMQCGLYVPAESFRASVCSGVFTHYKREEDSGMKRGKLDEELARMSAIVDQVRPSALMLFNESFASTNEREGSQIARQIVKALLAAGVRVVYVTHLYDLAQGFYLERTGAELFLRAERLPDGQRTFRIVEGDPLPTSYGPDLYRRIFGPSAAGLAGVAGAECSTDPEEERHGGELRHEAERDGAPQRQIIEHPDRHTPGEPGEAVTRGE